ncbi:MULTISPECIES: FMN-binding protein MioC [Hafnia]|uniref:Protein MioC n=1 Tax=Hafnia alvei ATCC 51873 TaxID=1002364 RepID=G9Y9C1_HAFAL|nr:MULTISPECIES: FMN-binding protein MioC [Hafnia]AJR01364.1 Flavoprotein MioC [Enterobacteriaceae bacterium bta3-1]EHM40856.1 protein MioC [Hafnia alvei ATCC 51873]OFS10857.1 FMN-binding protein MioC [Hafnia sp. HMSC23F03]QQE42807.1 FMN-binding protein MioC [Hafnia alvei]
MADITLISGSTLGSAEYVAEHLAEKLEEQGYSTEILHGPELDEVPLQGIWLVVTSTHGAGELPDNLQPLFEQIETQQPDLTQVRFGAVGIGSSEYDTFCGGIKIVDRVLIASGAQRIGEVLEIDVTKHEIPEDPAEIWLTNWVKVIN